MKKGFVIRIWHIDGYALYFQPGITICWTNNFDRAEIYDEQQLSLLMVNFTTHRIGEIQNERFEIVPIYYKPTGYKRMG